MPLSILNRLTPYEKYHGTKPNLEHLKVFGCLCFVSTLKQGRHKFSERAQKCVFLEYFNSKKGYKVYNIEQNIKIVSKDVIFYERLFSYHFMKNQSNLSELKPFFLPVCSEDSTPNIGEYNIHTTNPIQEYFDITNDVHVDISSETEPIKTNNEDNNNILLNNEDNNLSLAQRKSQRLTKPPKYLDDYCYNLTKHWCGLVQYKDIHNNTKQQLTYYEPTSFKEAITIPH